MSLHAQEIDLGLKRIQQVAKSLGLLKPQAKVITVAGTNGKGSSVAFLNAIYRAAGYQVGVYTSPHLLKFNERIVINGQMANDADIIAAFAAIEDARGQTKLTYFEFSTLAALWIFSQKPLDVIVLEVGLGGRLDAVNIIDADLALITAIDVDHVDWLGSDRNQIAIEKAGIMRSGRSAVCSDPNVPQTLIDYASQLKVDLALLGRDFWVKPMSKNAQAWVFLDVNSTELNLPIPALLGEFQIQNAAGVVACVQQLQKDLPVSIESLSQGLTQVTHAGRLQMLQFGQQDWLLDVAHNPQSAQVLAEYLAQQSWVADVAIFAALNDKDIRPMVQVLAPFIKRWVLLDLKVPRASSLASLQEILVSQGVVETNVESFLDTGNALLQILNQSMTQRVLVCGSFITVAQVMDGLVAYE